MSTHQLIFEVNLHFSRINAGVTSLSFGGGSIAREPDVPDFFERNNEALSRITSLTFLPDSKIRSLLPFKNLTALCSLSIDAKSLKALDSLESLPNVESLHLGVPVSQDALVKASHFPLRRLGITPTKKNDLSVLKAWPRLNSLALYYWPFPDFKCLQDTELHSLEVTKGSLQSTSGLHGKLQQASFAYCPRLISLDDLSVSTLHIDSCGRLPVSEIRRCRGLQKLHVRSTHLKSLSFLSDLEDLQHASLIATGMKLEPQDLLPPSLAFLSASGIQKQSLLNASLLNPKVLFFSSGYYKAGMKLTAEAELKEAYRIHFNLKD